MAMETLDPSLLMRKLIESWGELGSGPGQFNVPHGVWVADDRVFVADRENDRVQDLQPGRAARDLGSRPAANRYLRRQAGTGLHLLAVVASWCDGHGRPRRTYDLPGGVFVLDLAGNLLLHWCSADRCAPGAFVAPHCITADSRGDIYVGEVTWTYGLPRGYDPKLSHHPEVHPALSYRLSAIRTWLLAQRSQRCHPEERGISSSGCDD